MSNVMTHIYYGHRPNYSYGLGFVLIGPTVPELRPFENLTIKFGVKVMAEVKDHDPYLCISTHQFMWSWFRLNRTDGSQVMAI